MFLNQEERQCLVFSLILQLILLIYMILISLDTVLQRAAQHQENKLASQSMKSIQDVLKMLSIHSIS